MTIQSTGENAYFAASNSVSGFFSYYAEIFNAADVRRVYAIKGGPGTGKSRFLRDVAQAALERGGWRCEYVYCSSDPTSLDGVLLIPKNGGGSIALLDATAPHLFEPTLPGAREELVDLGRFWNSERLYGKREEIAALNLKKSEGYRRAYRFLAGFGEMSALSDSLVAPFVSHRKIETMAERLLADIPLGKGYSVRPALLHSVGMRGEVGFDTYFAEAKKRYVVEDCRGVAQYLMAALGSLAREMRLSVRISHDPIEPQKLDGIFFCQSGLAIAVCSSAHCSFPHKTVRMRRFVDIGSMKQVRGEVNYAARMCRAMRQGAIEELQRVGEVHFRLEEIYAAAMDFPAKEAFTKNFCHALFHLQKE